MAGKQIKTVTLDDPLDQSEGTIAYLHACKVCEDIIRELDEELERYDARRRKHAGSCDKVQP